MVDVVLTSDSDDIVSRVQPSWKPVRVENAHVVMQDVTRHSRRPGCQPKALAVHAVDFLFRLARRNGWVGDDDDTDELRRSFTYADLGRAMLEPDENHESPYSAFEKVLAKLPAEIAVELRNVVGQISESVRMVTEAQTDELRPTVEDNSESTQIPLDQPSAEPLQADQQTRRQRFGDFDVDIRKDFRKIQDGKKKLEVIKQVADLTASVDKKTFSNALRLFCSQTVAPILYCLREHFFGDEEKFLKAWVTIKFQHAKFSKICGAWTEKCKLQSTDQ